MAAVKYDDLREAFDFVSFGEPMEHCAYIELDTGRVYWVSELNPIDEEELPEDLGEPGRFIEVPHNRAVRPLSRPWSAPDARSRRAARDGSSS